MAEYIYYEIGVGLGGLFASAFFLTILNQNDGWKWRIPAFKFTGALTFFSIMVLTQFFGNTWEVIRMGPIVLPSLHVFFESIVLAFMLSGLWDIWTMNLDAA
jgi:ABC-type Fe3+-siderophore transport system permease subunit